MDEHEWRVSHLNGRLVLVGQANAKRRVLRVGDVFDLWTGSRWQRVTFQSGGYRGRYVETAEGHRERLAFCMKARLVG